MWKIPQSHTYMDRWISFYEDVHTTWIDSEDVQLQSVQFVKKREYNLTLHTSTSELTQDSNSRRSETLNIG